MEPEAATAFSILDCIAACNEQFISLRIWLRNELNIKTLSRALDCRAYMSGTMIEFYIEAELDGKAICWWLDVTWKRQIWLIQSRVYVKLDGKDQEVLNEFPDRVPRTLDDFIEQLAEATSDLVSYARSMDLSPPDRSQ
jgi:hypothetical protein